jgi:hypothetical protein
MVVFFLSDDYSFCMIITQYSSHLLLSLSFLVRRSCSASGAARRFSSHDFKEKEKESQLYGLTSGVSVFLYYLMNLLSTSQLKLVDKLL